MRFPVCETGVGRDRYTPKNLFYERKEEGRARKGKWTPTRTRYYHLTPAGTSKKSDGGEPYPPSPPHPAREGHWIGRSALGTEGLFGVTRDECRRMYRKGVSQASAESSHRHIRRISEDFEFMKLEDFWGLVEA